jgi:hypothetical protein
MRQLAGLGLCLVILALVIRGAMSSLRRQIAAERQHERATGQPGNSAKLSGQERLLSRLSFAALGLGLALTAVGLIFG